MPNLLAFNAAQFLGLFLVLSRVSGVMITAPILNDQTIPPTVKIGFTLLLSLIFYPVVTRPIVPAGTGAIEMLLLIAGELAVGLTIGFTAQLMFAGIEMAGEIIGFQMGVSMAHVFDPAFNTQTSLIAEINTVLALMLFVTLNGHHIFIEALARSFAIAQPGHIVLGKAALANLTAVSGKLFVVGLQIGAPLIVSLLAANLALGLVARAVPQINIFVVGFPFTIGMGLILMAAAFPFFVEGIEALQGGLDAMVTAGVRALAAP
jgi:flagellar biosynthesis protein FliR